MNCVDYERHELFLKCDHPKETWVRTQDGCSGSVCNHCLYEFGIAGWRDMVEIDNHDARQGQVMRAAAELAVEQIDKDHDAAEHRKFIAGIASVLKERQGLA